ncbi:unnamed protein product, partial [marine sediment metagenome]
VLPLTIQSEKGKQEKPEQVYYEPDIPEAGQRKILFLRRQTTVK